MVSTTSQLDSYDLTSCDMEPIHRPGAIQPHGALLVLRTKDLRVVQASANIEAFLGVAHAAVVNSTAADVFGEITASSLRAAFDAPGRIGVAPVTYWTDTGSLLDVTWHAIADQGGGLVIVELEVAEPGGAAEDAALVEETRRALESMESTQSVAELRHDTAREVRRLTGYERVMIYRFHADEHGEVVSEASESRLEPFLGLHYPASDIPQQARRLYRLNHLRVIDSVQYSPVAVVPASTPDGDPLDLSGAALRSVSPVHLQYLANMGVRSSMSISLMRGNELWGLIACHHYTGARRVPARLRAACLLIGQMFALKIAADDEQVLLFQRERLGFVQAEIIAAVSGADSLAEGFAAASPLRLADADGVLAMIDGETIVVGTIPPPPAVDALLAEVRADGTETVHAFDRLPTQLSAFAEHAGTASGALVVTLSSGLADVLVFFRREFAHSVTWAGDPVKAMEVAPSDAHKTSDVDQLRPRVSFEAFLQEVRGRCRPWASQDLAAADGLARVFPKLLLDRARERLADSVLYDNLTGLPNRTLISRRIDDALHRTRAAERQPVVIVVALDRFKTVNDSLGRVIGDQVLIAIADRLRSIAGSAGTGRLGGAEFIIFSESSTTGDASHLAAHVLRTLRQPLFIGGRELLVTASIGFALADTTTSAADLLANADTAVHVVKHSGHNATALFTPAMQAASARHNDIETRVNRAFANGEIQLHYQPLFHISGKLVGFEALARWTSPEIGIVAPDEFIPVIEDLGMIGPFTTWALHTALGELTRWRAHTSGSQLTMSVNVTAKQMTAGLLGAAISAALTTHCLPPEALCLEITEGALVTDEVIKLRYLEDLNDLGVRLSVDDFGTGFSSLAYLAQLPVHELKIDRAFVDGMLGQDNYMTVISSVIDLAHRLGLVALAEGVETTGQHEALRQLGCDLIQGYLTARPTPPAEIDLRLPQLLALTPE